jgi:hypothetical protein
MAAEIEMVRGDITTLEVDAIVTKRFLVEAESMARFTAPPAPNCSRNAGRLAVVNRGKRS